MFIKMFSDDTYYAEFDVSDIFYLPDFEILHFQRRLIQVLKKNWLKSTCLVDSFTCPRSFGSGICGALILVSVVDVDDLVLLHHGQRIFRLKFPWPWYKQIWWLPPTPHPHRHPPPQPNPTPHPPIGSGNGLAPNRRQAVTCTNDYPPSSLLTHISGIRGRWVNSIRYFQEFLVV